MAYQSGPASDSSFQESRLAFPPPAAREGAPQQPSAVLPQAGHQAAAERLNLLQPNYAQFEDVRKALAVVFPGISFSDEQLRGLVKASRSSERRERQTIQEAFEQAASGKGQEILTKLRGDEHWKFDQFAAAEGPMAALRVVSSLWSSAGLRSVLQEDRQALGALADRVGKHPLKFFDSSVFGSENFLRALTNPEYLSRICSGRGEALYQEFGGLVTGGGKRPQTLITDDALTALSQAPAEKLLRLKAAAQYLERTTNFRIESWARLYELYKELESGKLPPDFVEVLKSKEALVRAIAASGTDIGFSDYYWKSSDDKSPPRSAVSLETLVSLIRRPEWTAENYVWAQKATTADIMARIAKSKLEVKEEPGFITAERIEKRDEVLTEFKDAVDNRPAIDGNLEKIREHGEKVLARLGRAAEDWDSRLWGLGGLIYAGKPEASALIREALERPEDRQVLLIQHGSIINAQLSSTQSREQLLQSLDRDKEFQDGEQKRAQTEREGARLVQSFRKAFPGIELSYADESAYLRELLQKAGIAKIEDLSNPDVRTAIAEAAAVLDRLGADVSLGNVAAVLGKPQTMAEIKSAGPLLPFLYRVMRESVDRMAEGGELASALALMKELTPEHRALLGFGAAPATGKPVAPDQVDKARAYLRGVMILQEGLWFGLNDDRTPLTARTIAVGPQLLTYMKTGLADSHTYDAFRELIEPLLTYNSKALAIKPFKEVEKTPEEKAHFFSVIQQPEFLSFVEMGRSHGVPFIADTRTLADLFKDSLPDREKFKESPLYTAYRLFLLDREHNQVISRLLEMDIKIPADVFKGLALHEFLTWPELQRAVANPEVRAFAKEHSDSFSFVLPYDLVVINERILPALNAPWTAIPRGYLQSEEYARIRARLRGEESAVPQDLRYNFHEFRPPMLAEILALKAKGIDVLAALDEGEKLAAAVKAQARPNDALLFAQSRESAAVQGVFEDPRTAGEKMDALLGPVYGMETRSGEWKYENAADERQFTRPKPEGMHPVVKLQAGLLARALHDEGFVRRLKMLALQSWEREFPFSLKLRDGDDLELEVHQNLMGDELGKVSALRYDAGDFTTSFMEGHSHPSVVRNQPAKYNTVPSGIRDDYGDIRVGRFARGAVMLSIANHKELNEAFTARQSSAKELLQAAADDPSVLDQVKINLDFYYMDVPAHQKSSLDLGVY